MKINFTVTLILSSLIISGCASNQYTPLIFGQSQTVGISIGAGAADQGADFVFGYKDKNIALIPVTLQTGENSHAQIISTKSSGYKDALSVFGQFEVQTDTSAGNVGLGKFFATGTAATTLATGFKNKLGAGAAKPVTDPAVVPATQDTVTQTPSQP